MIKFQFWALIAIIALLVTLILITVLPPTGWAIIGLILASYGFCWVIERAMRRVWRRR